MYACVKCSAAASGVERCLQIRLRTELAKAALSDKTKRARTVERMREIICICQPQCSLSSASSLWVDNRTEEQNGTCLCVSNCNHKGGIEASLSIGRLRNCLGHGISSSICFRLVAGEPLNVSTSSTRHEIECCCHAHKGLHEFEFE